MDDVEIRMILLSPDCECERGRGQEGGREQAIFAMTPKNSRRSHLLSLWYDKTEQCLDTLYGG